MSVSTSTKRCAENSLVGIVWVASEQELIADAIEAVTDLLCFDCCKDNDYADAARAYLLLLKERKKKIKKAKLDE